MVSNGDFLLWIILTLYVKQYNIFPHLLDHFLHTDFKYRTHGVCDRCRGMLTPGSHLILPSNDVNNNEKKGRDKYALAFHFYPYTLYLAKVCGKA